MPTRDLANKRIQVLVGPASMVANLQAPTAAECASLLHVSAAVRWNGLAFGMQASAKVDDRSLDDDASARLNGFPQYGGAVPVFYPKALDATSILRMAFNTFKTQGTDLAWIERIGWGSTSDEVVAGDNVNAYLVTTDGFAPDTEGDGGYAYLLTMLARGLAYPWTIVAPTGAPVAVTIDGPATASLTAGHVALLRAHYQGNDVTLRGTWRSSDPTKVEVVNGIVVGVAAGTANVYCTFPGATESVAVAVTVS